MVYGLLNKGEREEKPAKKTKTEKNAQIRRKIDKVKIALSCSIHEM